MKRASGSVGAIAAAVLLGGFVNPGAAEESHREAVNPYPLASCLVSGEELGSMGEPHTLVFKQELTFCCKGCVKDFKKDPLAYLAKLAAAAEKAKREHAGKREAGTGHKDSGHSGAQPHSGHDH